MSGHTSAQIHRGEYSHAASKPETAEVGGGDYFADRPAPCLLYRDILNKVGLCFRKRKRQSTLYIEKWSFDFINLLFIWSCVHTHERDCISLCEESSVKSNQWFLVFGDSTVNLCLTMSGSEVTGSWYTHWYSICLSVFTCVCACLPTCRLSVSMSEV